MAEYIEREALIREMEKQLNFLVDNNYAQFGSHGLAETNGFAKAIDLVYYADIADVVEVVRCENCAVPHNKWTGCPKLNGLVTPPDFYCGFGERKDK